MKLNSTLKLLMQFVSSLASVDVRLIYRKTSGISRTKSLNFTVSHVILQLPLPNPLKPGVKSSMKM